MYRKNIHIYKYINNVVNLKRVLGKSRIFSMSNEFCSHSKTTKIFSLLFERNQKIEFARIVFRSQERSRSNWSEFYSASDIIIFYSGAQWKTKENFFYLCHKKTNIADLDLLFLSQYSL